MSGTVTHTVHEKQRLVARTRRIHAPDEAIERALNRDAACKKVIHLLSSTRAAMSGLMAEVVEDHVRTHLVDVEAHPGALNGDAVEQLLGVVRTYLK